MKSKNGFLERKAVQLCCIQPDDEVLEVGFGPGIGIKEALKHVNGDDFICSSCPAKVLCMFS